MSDVRVREALGADELRAVGALTAEAYHADRLLAAHDDYEVELRDAEHRAQEAAVLVALVPHAGADPAADDEHGVVVGTVTLAPYGTSYAEVAVPGEVEVRMLAVAPEARRRGVAEALVRAALDHAVAAGSRRVVLSTIDAMTAAHRLYARLGFVPAPARDWAHGDVHVRVHVWEPPAGPGAQVETATWAPVAVEHVGPWRLGLSGGFTRRANSVVALGEPDDVDAAIEAVEERYAAAGLPSVFRVCPSSRPADLGARLLARGYRSVSRTSVLVRGIEPPAGDEPDAVDGTAARGASAAGVRFIVTDEPDDRWLDGWLAVKASGTTDTALARGIVTGSAARYVTALDEQGVVGVIRAAHEQDWVGLSCLMVAPRARRRGLGRALTHVALRDAGEHGARRAFLQVEAQNLGARQLYLALGFEAAEVYEYCER